MRHREEPAKGKCRDRGDAGSAEVPVDNMDEYRECAARRLRLAQPATDEAERALLIAMAQGWVEMAKRLERHLPRSADTLAYAGSFEPHKLSSEGSLLLGRALLDLRLFRLDHPPDVKHFTDIGAQTSLRS
jgi:hypothetical protein